MLKNHIKTALKSLTKNKYFSSVTIGGLALGIAACLLILIYVENELSFENFHEKKQNIYRIATEWGTEGNMMKFAGSMPALAEALKEEVPEVEESVRIRKDYDAKVKTANNQEFNEENLFFADEGIFNIFSFKLLNGDRNKALTDPMTIVISKNIAEKYFGNAAAVGKELFYNNTPLKVTGVMENIPENTHLQCDMIVSYSSLKAMGEIIEEPWNQWGEDLTYVLLRDNTSPSSIMPKLKELLSKNSGELLASRIKFDIQPLTEIHWDSETRGDIGAKGNKTYVYIFLSAAIFLLVIASFNFLNLSISQYLRRMKEVAIRKTFGARKKQMITQFITESIIIILISCLTALFLFGQINTWLYSYLGADYLLKDNHIITLVLLVFVVLILLGIAAGIYPAVFISRLRPIEILYKDKEMLNSRLTLRKLLIMLQFSISIILLVGTFIIYRQLDYMKNSNLGFKKENVVLLNFPGTNKKISSKYEVLRDELLKNSNIRYVSGAYTMPGINSQMNMGVRIYGTPQESSVNIQALPADYGFTKSMGLEIVEGRDFSKDYATDSYGSVILSQSAVESLGLKDPIGTKLFIPGEEYKNGVKVIGVFRDFHVQSFHEKINPMLIFINPKMFMTIAIRMIPQNIDQTIDYVKNIWSSVLPGVSLDYRYLEDAYDNLYNAEAKSGLLLLLFTVLALFISCLGLFGFASFIITRRIKEVGIRKVLGSRVSGISLLLSGQYARMILISSLIACPVAYMLAKSWLEGFAFRIKISWWIFIAAILAELLIALVTVSWLSMRTATRNPLDALRYE